MCATGILVMTAGITVMFDIGVLAAPVVCTI